MNRSFRVFLLLLLLGWPALLWAETWLAWDYFKKIEQARLGIFLIFQHGVGQAYDLESPAWAITDPSERAVLCGVWHMPGPGQYWLVMQAWANDGEKSITSKEMTFWWSATTGCSKVQIVAESPPAPPPTPNKPPPVVIPIPPVPPKPPSGSLPLIPWPPKPPSSGSGSGGLTDSCVYQGTC